MSSLRVPLLSLVRYVPRIVTMSEQMNKELDSRLAWPFALVIIALLAMTEVLPMLFQLGSTATADWISFIYVTMRFIILPIACLAHVGLIIFRIIKTRHENLKIKQISSAVVSVGYLLLLYFHPLPLSAWK